MSAPSKGLMRVTNHPRNDEWLLLKFGPDLNGIIHSFGPAQQALDLGGYIMHRENLDSLRNWCRYQTVTLFDESRSSAAPTKAVECGNHLLDGSRCAAPYRANAIPKFCPTCGQSAKPVVFEDDEPTLGAKCPSCERIHHGGPKFCPSCGATMPERHLSSPAVHQPRIKAEPITLAAAIAATPELHHEEESAE